MDQKPELISRDLDLWAISKGVVLDFSRPGKSTDNAFIEAFNDRLRSEGLDAHWFMSLLDASEKLEAWRVDYNQLRSYSANQNRAPQALIKHPDVASQAK